MATSSNGTEGAAERSGAHSSRSEILPPAVEAVVCMGYPPDLVIATFQQLVSAREQESHTSHPAPRNGATALTRNAPWQSVSAASLLAAVDDALRHSSFSSSQGIGLAAPSESSFSLDALQGHEYGEGRLSEREAVQVDGLEDDEPPAPQQCSSDLQQQQCVGQAAANSTPPSTDSQTSSVTGQLSSAERAVQPMETTSTSTAAGTVGLETASSLTVSGAVSSPADSPEGAPASTASTSPTQNAAKEFSSANAASGSEAAISAVTTTAQYEATPPSTACAESTATTAQHEATPPSTACAESTATTAQHEATPPSTACAESTATTAQHEATPPSTACAESTATTAQHEATPPSTACAKSTAASRDRSPGRGEGPAAPTEEEAREKRRQLLTRLQALREENRRLKARQTCLHCRQNPVALTLLPCGHFCLCQECGASFDTCPLCGKTVLADVRTFVT